jgi:hypothetical protein
MIPNINNITESNVQRAVSRKNRAEDIESVYRGKDIQKDMQSI